MSSKKISVVILAAGQGKRMGSGLPKVLRPLHGRPMLKRILSAAQHVQNVEEICIVTSGHNRTEIEECVGDTYVFVQQSAQKGTAKAVESWTQYPYSKGSHALILSGDTPLLTTTMLNDFVKACDGYDAGLVVFTPEETKEYGRVQRTNHNTSCVIREFRDCSPSEREMKECNAGIYFISKVLLDTYLPRIDNHNSQSEFYLPDIFHLLSSDQQKVYIHSLPQHDIFRLAGVNTIQDLHEIESYFHGSIERLQKTDILSGAYERLLMHMHGVSDATNLTESERLEAYLTWFENNSVNIFIIRHPLYTTEIVASVLVWLDPKPFRSYRSAAHVEDVVVHPDWRNNGFALQLIRHAVTFADKNNCYKVILDCDPHLVEMYKQAGFSPQDTHMVRYHASS